MTTGWLGGARCYGKIAAQHRLIDQNGRELPGYLDDSARTSRRAVIVVHDFFGITQHTRSVTQQLALEGFLAFAPDLYRGEVATTREEAIVLAQSIAWNRVAIELGLVVDALKSRTEAGPVAILGFAMGGAAALVAAAAIEKLTAAITYYGIPQDVSIDNPRIQIQGHFAARDAKCTPARASALERALAERGVQHELHRYDADNGFCNPTRPELYSAADAETAWSRSLAFLRSALTE